MNTGLSQAEYSPVRLPLSILELPLNNLERPGRKQAIMAKVTLPSWITGIKGRVGDVVFRVSQNGETYITRTPDMSAVEWSPAQQDHRQRFKAAIAYAKAVMADPDLWAHYEK